MSAKKLILIINADQGYIRCSKKEPSTAQNELLFSAITQTYIPLLNMIERLQNQNINFKFGLVLSPSLCTLLSDKDVQAQYSEYLEKLIALGKSETERLKNTLYETQVSDCLNKIIQIKEDFEQKYNSNLIPYFKKANDDGVIELLSTTATYAYLPHYSEFQQVLNAQIETGLYAQRSYFGEIGDGFFLPYLGWGRGMEFAIRSYGINYTIVDPKSILFSKNFPDNGIYAPVRTRNSLVIFANEPYAKKQLLGNDAYSKHRSYKNQHIDIGFMLDSKLLEPFIQKNEMRVQTLYKYWSNACEDLKSEDQLIPYDKFAAEEQAKLDAQDFFEKRLELLTEAEKSMNNEDAISVCTIPSELLGQTWAEGINWLENLIRIIAGQNEIKLSVCKENLKNQFNLQKVDLYPCSENGLGYGEDLIDKTNNWMVRYLRTATKRMLSLTERFPNETSLKERLLNAGAKQLLLAQSSAWPQLLHDNRLSDYIKEKFSMQIINFSRIFDSLASNTVSTEWLTKLEKDNPIFPWLNYRIFSEKK